MRGFRLSVIAVVSLLLAIIAQPMSAQQHPNRQGKGKLKYVIGDNVNISDSVNAYKLLFENIPLDKDFINDPIFAIVGKNRSFYFSVGANLKFTSCYDWGNPSDDPSGMSVAGIQKAAPGDNTLYQMTAQGSNIYFNIIGFPSSAHQIGLFISLAMDSEPGNSYKVHASNVYMRYRNFTFGYTSSLYNDKSADPYTIDGHGPIASGSHDIIQMNFQKFITPHVRVGASIEAPRSDYTSYIPDDPDSDDRQPELRQHIPDLPMYVTYAFNSTDHVRISTVLRGLSYRDHIAHRNHTLFGWGLKLTGAAKFGPVVAYGMAQTGRGISSYIQENKDLGLDLVPDMSRPGRLKEPWAWGCILGLQYNWRPNLFSTVVYSYMRNYVDPYTNGSFIPYGDQLRYGQYALCNVIWQISPLFRTGIEYVHGQKNVFSHSRLSNNRVSALLSMSF